MERDVLITLKGVNYGAGTGLTGIWTSDKLTLGSLAMFDESGTLVAAAASSITGDNVTLAVMNPNGFKSTIPITRDGFKYTAKVWAGPRKTAKYLGSDTAAAAGAYSLNLPTSLAVGDVVSISIRDRSKEASATNAIKTYSFTAVTGDLLTGQTAKNIITKLVAAINADTSSIVTATAMNDGTDNDGIKLEAKEYYVDFDIVREDGVLKDADIVEYKVVNRVYDSASTNAVAYFPGQGTDVEAAKAMYDSYTRDGDTHTQVLTNYMFTGSSNLVTGETYKVYTLYFNAPTDSPLNREANFKQMVQIFAPKDDTSAGQTCAVLDHLLPLV